MAFGNITASISLCNADARKTRRFAVTFEKGALVYDDVKADKLCRGADAGSAKEPVALGDGLPLSRCVRSFADAIAAGRPDHGDAALGRDVAAVIERLDKAIG